MKKLVLSLIRLYQHVVPLRIARGACRFQPTCSQYVYEAIKRYGIVKGVFLGTKRIARCHPWSKGGVDPIPSL
ncbi:membrane protein insertion efficiency factor YidD [Patescibacteria group bacterium]|nr:membrane protein insertion efficiency factor YidD [Patescibacteria group bacterium]